MAQIVDQFNELHVCNKGAVRCFDASCTHFPKKSHVAKILNGVLVNIVSVFRVCYLAQTDSAKNNQLFFVDLSPNTFLDSPRSTVYI